MENQENNNMSELDQLKAQYETLKQQFDQQEIVNDRLMKSSIKRSTDFYKRYRTIQFIVYPLMVIVGLLTIKWLFDNNLSLRLFWVAFCVICFVVELWMTRMVRFKTLENNDLLTLSNHARSFKKLYAIYVVSYVISIIILVSGFLLMETGNGSTLPNWRAFLLVLCLVLVLVVLVGIAEIRYKTRPCDEIIRQIEAAEPTVNKKTGFDRRQKWFCMAMIVAFLGLDVWAYTIVASRLKLPPIWYSMNYVRPADDFSSEGTLEFWEVYADTLVAEEDVSAVMENWQRGDSLVVMRSDCQPNPEDMSHGTSRLYALKRTTSEGPAISSAVLGGKPMVAFVSFTHPRRNPNNEPVQLFVFMTSEARQLWYQFTTEIAGHRTAIVMDGIVIQDWQIMCGIDNGKFLITREWSSKDEVEAFCKRLIRQ
jgi:membrane protein YdbS with pleckstrin-like domain